MYIVKLKPHEEKRILYHPWVYANEVASIEGKEKQGSIAKVESADGRLVGYGFINHTSKILVRILSRKEETWDKAFFADRIAAADEYRQTLGYGDSYRVVFGESDDLPGLIVDKYGDYLCVQLLCLGMDVRRDMLVEVLVERFAPKGIYERSDVPVRQKEGLPMKTGVLYGDVPDMVTIQENGCLVTVDIKHGQKTGYFLDQKENRNNIKRYVSGKRVLDCFCNAGGFALCAAQGGAKSVTAVDISEDALQLVRHSVELNGYDNIECVQADVFEWLRDCRKDGQMFDVIVLDPPAFTKSKDTVKQAYAGYKDINILAMKLLAPGGVLITCSCSQHLGLPLFVQMLEESVRQSGVAMRMIELRTQARDHATRMGLDEALYLKAAVLGRM